VKILNGRLAGRTIPLRRFVNRRLKINLSRPDQPDREIDISPTDVQLTPTEVRAIQEHPQAARFLQEWMILEDGTLQRIPVNVNPTAPTGGIVMQEATR